MKNITHPVAALVLCATTHTNARSDNDVAWDIGIGLPGAFSIWELHGGPADVGAIVQGQPQWGAAGVYAGGTWFSMGEDLDSDQELSYGVARWDGHQWNRLQFGLDVDEPFGERGASVFDLVFHDDGHGTALFVAGQFDRAYHGFQDGNVDENSIFAGNVARWNGTSPEVSAWDFEIS